MSQPSNVADLDKEGFTITWADEAHTVILARYPKNWSMPVGYDALDRIADFMDEATVERVTVIFDLVEAGIPSEATKHYRRLISNRFLKHRRLGQIISAIGDKSFAEIPIKVFSQLSSLYKGKEIKPAKTLEDAYKLAGIGGA
jgi:hypothetical protein